MVAFLNLYDIGNAKLKSKLIHPRSKNSYYPENKLDNVDQLLIPPRQIISLSKPDAVAKSFLERIWNAYGFEEVPDFKNDGYYPEKSN